MSAVMRSWLSLLQAEHSQGSARAGG